MTTMMTAKRAERTMHEPRYITECRPNLDPLPTEKLRSLFRELARATVNEVIQMATIVRIFDERGEPEPIPGRLSDWLRRIAYGQFLPELFVRFLGRNATLKQLQLLPASEQERFIREEPFAVVELGEQGPTHRLIHPQDLDDEQIRQLVAFDGHLRTEAEQVTYLKKRRDQGVGKPVPVSRDIEIDREHRCVYITARTRLKLSAKQLMDLLDRLR